MDEIQFESVFPVIIAGLVNIIMVEYGISEDEAMDKLYSSALYSALENEKTKIWYYSVPKLYELFTSEMKSGKLELPEY